MYVVTNREIFPNKSGLEKFGSSVNAKGPNELRVVKVEQNGNDYDIELLADELPKAKAKKLIEQHSLALDPKAQHWISLQVAVDITEKARKNKSHVLFFVHGFNNDVGDVLKRAFALQQKYGVEVIPFTWPANGGGVAGVVSYKSDKRDARASTGALERTLKIMREHFVIINEGQQRKLLASANAKHPDNQEARDSLYTRLLEKECPFTFNAMFHSMGNYLLKQMLKSSVTEGNDLTFDNVVLVAADTNNLDHKDWVDSMQFRKRLFITINEDDVALRASRAKFGSNQLARLGHYVKALDSVNAHYVNFTSAAWVKNSHAYFEEPADKNNQVAAFFQKAFRGEAAEENLKYRAEGNWYEV